MAEHDKKTLAKEITKARKSKSRRQGRKPLGKDYKVPRVSITPVGKQEEAELRDPEKHGFGPEGRKSRRNADGSTSYISRSVLDNYRVSTYGKKEKAK